MAGTREALTQVLRTPANYTQVFVDLSVDTADPPRVTGERRKSMVDRLRDVGASERDIDALVDVLATSSTPPGQNARYLVVNDGEIVVDETLPGSVAGGVDVSVGTIPNVLPLIEREPLDFSFIVVETSRDGGDVRLYRAGSAVPDREQTVDGETEGIHKIPGGGWRHDHLQNHTEGVWRQNQEQLGQLVDELVREQRPRFIVVAGDVRACQLLEDALSEEAKTLLVVEHGNVRADGASDAALAETINAQIDRILASDRDEVLDRLRMHEGRGDNTVEVGLGGVVQALAAAQADTVILSTRELADRELLALDQAPWVATAPEEALNAEIIGRVPAELALVRAALLTDARVLLAESLVGDAPDPEAPHSAALPNNAPAAALLRWRTGPAVPGVDDI